MGFLNEETKEFYNRETWRKMLFRQYSYGKKSVDKFINKIKETFGDNIIIGYGNWSRDTQMKGCLPTMNKGLRRLICKKYDTVSINEYNTSKKCCKCKENLINYKDKKNKKVHRLLVCSSDECVTLKKPIAYRSRDINAALNIMILTKEYIKTQTRPEEFVYSKNLTSHCETHHVSITEKS